MCILSIIIPAFNAEKHLNELIDKIMSVDLIENVGREIIVVNDGSTDNTAQIISNYLQLHPNYNIKFFSFETRSGATSAIRKGIDEASGDFILIQDTTLEYEPDDYNTLLKPIINSKADAVFGSRFIGGRDRRVLTLQQSVNLRFSTFINNLYSGLHLNDPACGLKLFKSEIIKNIPLKGGNHDFNDEISRKIANIEGVRIYEVGVSYNDPESDGIKEVIGNGFRSTLTSILRNKKFPKGIKLSSGDAEKNIAFRKRSSMVYLILAIAFFFVTGLHNATKHYRPEYKTILRSDGLGYYQYLPATFIRHSVASGQPWCVMLKEGGLLNRFTWGVAYMQSPFFFLANAWCSLTNQLYDGYGNTHAFFILLGAMVYCFLALLLIYKILLPRFGRFISIIVPVMLFYGTNLIFYTLSEAAMSHVYTFFLFAWFVYVTPLFYKKPSLINVLMLAVPLAVITLIRSYNITIVLYLLLYNVASWKELKDRFLFWLSKWYYGAVLILTICAAFIPQIVYWHLVTGHWLINSYGYQQKGDAFLYLLEPRIFKVLFGNVSGIFTYAPILLLSLAGMIMMLRKRNVDIWAIVIIFLISLYLIASWWSYTFSCGFGHRGFIDYYVLFAVPMAFTLQKLYSSRKWLLHTFLSCLFVCLFYVNIRLSMMYNWNPCWIEPDWTWKHYTNVMHKAAVGGDYKQDYHNLK